MELNSFIQLCTNSIVTASSISLVGIGFAIVYRVGNFLHFAHGIIFTAAAYLLFLFISLHNLPLILSLILTLLITVALGVFIHLVIYRPLQNMKAPSPIMLLASLGIYIVIQNLISIIFGDALKVVFISPATKGFLVLGARMTAIQFITILVSLILLTSLTLFLKISRYGKAIRAVGNDPELAKVSGIPHNKINSLCIAISSLLAGVAGILVAFDVGMVPSMGMEALMMAVVAVIVGGVGSIPGILLAALLIGFARNLGGWVIGTEWHDFSVFVILLLFLLKRPQGIFGKKIRKASV
jgi:branched-chain amino acid transport system permease protein